MRDAAVWVLTLLMLSLAVWVGYKLGHTDAQSTLVAARHATNTCLDNARAKQDALDAYARQATDNDRELRAMQARADAALQSRDALRAEVHTLGERRRRELETKAHEDADCTALADLPLCPAVAHIVFHPADARTDEARGDHDDP